MATFRAGGDEDDFDDDDFMLGNEEILTDEKPTILGPVKKTAVGDRKQKPFQNGFGEYKPAALQGHSADDLRMAAMRGNKDVIENCLQQGVKVDEVLRCGWTALMYAANCSNPALVKFLVEKGADVNFHKDFYTVLMAACSSTRDNNGSVLECVKILIEAGADCNVRDRYHSSPLISAVCKDHVNVVKYLLEVGAEFNRQDTNGWTALSWACSKGSTQIVKLLLDKGANPDLKHSDGLRAIDNARNLQYEEIVCMLEGKPYEPRPAQAAVPNMVNGEKRNGFTPISGKKVEPVMNQVRKPPPPEGDLIPSDKPVERRHGELEVFLYGLELGHLIPLFNEQQVDFFNFLRFNEQDLINMGISQIGCRKKILDAIEIVHKKEWDTSSLISVQCNKHIGCPDAIAMVANISKHLCYIGSTVGYVSEQIKAHPNILADVRDGTGPRQLHKHTQDALKNVQALEKEISRLKTRLTSEMKTLNIDPPDMITKSAQGKSGRSHRLFKLVAASFVVTTVAVTWLKKDDIVEKGTAFFFKT